MLAFYSAVQFPSSSHDSLQTEWFFLNLTSFVAYCEFGSFSLPSITRSEHFNRLETLFSPAIHMNHIDLFREETILFSLLMLEQERKRRREASSKRFHKNSFIIWFYDVFLSSCLLIYELLDSNNGGGLNKRKSPISFILRRTDLKLIIFVDFFAASLDRRNRKRISERRSDWDS